VLRQNQTIGINVSVSNLGLDNSSGFNVSLYVDGVLNDSDEVALLDIQQNHCIAFNWSAVSGDHNLTVSIDTEGNIIESNESNKSNLSNSSNLTYKSYLTNRESFVNLMITLCFKEGYLLDQLVRSQQEKFIKTGGFRENLFKKRINYKNNEIR